MKEKIIQEEIKVDKDFIDRVIEEYKQQPKKYGVCIGEFSGDRDECIREIKKLSEVGKQLLLMKYKFKKWEKSLSTKKPSNNDFKAHKSSPKDSHNCLVCGNITTED